MSAGLLIILRFQVFKRASREKYDEKISCLACSWLFIGCRSQFLLSRACLFQWRLIYENIIA